VAGIDSGDWSTAMGKIVISENVSLDGVVEDPTGEEGFRHGGWFEQLGGDREAWAEVEYAEALAADALLLGRRSYHYFAQRWASRTGDWADRLRIVPKYVVSATLRDLAWDNSTVLTGDVVEAVSTLKREVAGDIVVYASSRLVPALIEHDLVDEVRLMVFPVVLGAGARVFGGIKDKASVRPLTARTVGEGLVSLTYEVVRDA
jgi:dihydrofolate reductase